MSRINFSDISIVPLVSFDKSDDDDDDDDDNDNDAELNKHCILVAILETVI